jgi:GR25 family glycosyltransferase involved in LPS biosynthesis
MTMAKAMLFICLYLRFSFDKLFKWFYGIPYFAPYFPYVVARKKIGCKEVPVTFTYINLEERPDRRQEVEEEFADVSNVKLERFNAILHTNRPLGCALSHIKVLEEIIARDDLYSVIIEDDFEFTMVPEVAMSRLYAALEELEKLGTWDVLMLSTSAYNLKKEDFSQDLSRVISAQTAGAYIVSRRYCETLLDNFKEGVHLLRDNPSKSKHFAIDQYWKRLQERGEWYITEPILAKQRPSLSSINDTFADYEF